MSSPPVLSGFSVTRSLVSCVCFVDRPFVIFLLAIVLSVLLRFTDYDYPFSIFNLFFNFDRLQNFYFQNHFGKSADFILFDLILQI